MTPSKTPTQAEMAILQILWNLERPATVREIHEKAGGGYTSVLKTLQIMTGKGLVERDEADRAHLYRPALERKQTENRLAGDLLQRVFGGSASRLVLSALSEGKASTEEIAEIRKMLKKIERGKK